MDELCGHILDDLANYLVIFLQPRSLEKNEEKRGEGDSAMAGRIQSMEFDGKKLFSSWYSTNWKVLNNMEQLLEQANPWFMQAPTLAK